MPCAFHNRGHLINRIWSNYLEQIAGHCPQLFTVARMEQPRPCQLHPSTTVPCIIAGCRQFLATTELKPFRNFHEAYSEEEKRLGDRHILNCHNHVYNTNTSTLRILG